MKKRLIKKKVKAMTVTELCEHLAYGSGYWRLFSEKEFERRLGIEWFFLKL
ncbi:hypothetical protein BTS2_0496 [Bacillus sp. TS-2]|nr:hypothetical protein BTS2_0496 [Bacillus sp. TS-2]